MFFAGAGLWAGLTIGLVCGPRLTRPALDELAHELAGCRTWAFGVLEFALGGSLWRLTRLRRIESEWCSASEAGLATLLGTSEAEAG